MKPSSFHIYDASAGSGKTYTLVKEYLKALFTSSAQEPYRYILAITFTNKAVDEMKSRVIKNLMAFSERSILDEPTTMFTTLSENLNIPPSELHKRAQIILQRILHNYSAFEISTIDRFTQKLIRSFAYDLRLPINFEVELDTEELLAEAVDNLISKAGIDKNLTKVLIEFAIEKSDDDKSWNIAYDFNEISKLLTNENHLSHISHLKGKSIEAFELLKTSLKKDVAQVELEIEELANSILHLIAENGLSFTDFSGGYLPKFFEKLSNKTFKVNLDAGWQNTISETPLYPKRITPEIASIIDAIQPQLSHALSVTKRAIYHQRFLRNFYANITPLSVLNAIHKEAKQIEKDENLLLISEFNTIVSDHLKTQPVPFIYERIGDKFKHFFIDEFQDTSVMQWENLVPLIANALSSENTSTTLVGDAKQAIYRWRGGRAEQFINLSGGKSSFPFEAITKELKENYRSHKTIVEFNNSFFNYLSTSIFNNIDYQNLYAESNQDIIIDDSGYVNLSFLTFDKKEDKNEVYGEKILETILSCRNQGFELNEICILVRKRKEGIAIAEYLTAHSDINIISSETLLIANSPEVIFVLNVLRLLTNPEDKEIRIALLSYLLEYTLLDEDKHSFYANRVHLSVSAFFESFSKFNIVFDYNKLLSLSLYELVERIIKDFNLIETSNAYLQYFLDFVLDYEEKKYASVIGLLHHFEKKKEKLSIVTPSQSDAVNIMTIHKAKGLEFPVVIFPYANLNIYEEVKPKTWLKVNELEFNGFKEAFISFKEEIENYNENGAQIYETHRGELELDNINLLYVAMTRPEEQLYIISHFNLDKSGNPILKETSYSGIFMKYLEQLNLWSSDLRSYEFGATTRSSSVQRRDELKTVKNRFRSSSTRDLNINIHTKSGSLWDTDQQEAIEKGNLIHLVMSKIHTRKDVDFALKDLLLKGQISSLQIENINPIVSQIVNHKELAAYYENDLTVLNERDIICRNGNILRPDRIVFLSKQNIVLIDYKTGVFKKEHIHQLKQYESVIKEMNISVQKKILIYINDDIEVKEI